MVKDTTLFHLTFDVLLTWMIYTKHTTHAHTLDTSCHVKTKECKIALIFSSPDSFIDPPDYLGPPNQVGYAAHAH